jgi:hypothetical protein
MRGVMPVDINGGLRFANPPYGLIQFHHWYDQKKPCHLCFQMEENQSIRGLFLADVGGV